MTQKLLTSFTPGYSERDPVNRYTTRYTIHTLLSDVCHNPCRFHDRRILMFQNILLELSNLVFKSFSEITPCNMGCVCIGAVEILSLKSYS